MINASELRWRVELFEPGPDIDDGFTTRPGGYLSRGQRAAKYLPSAPSESFDGGARESRMPAAFIVRRDMVSVLIDATWKLSFDGESYDVQGVNRHDTDGLLIRAIASDNVWGGGGYST